MSLYEAILEEDQLWRRFHRFRNEMIITKLGRCMFPILRISFTSQIKEDRNPKLWIEADVFYRVKIGMHLLDRHKWKWRDESWIPMVTAESFISTGSEVGDNNAGGKDLENMATIHSKILGKDLIEEGIICDKIKLVNRSCQDNNSLISLQSFRHYLPIIRLEKTFPSSTHQQQNIHFPQTAFIAVTHYQNDRITLLKKSHNPHAKGFVYVDQEEGNGGEGRRRFEIGWSLNSPPPTTTSSPNSISPHGKTTSTRNRIRKRVKPVEDASLEPEVIHPSDEEEFQGGVALQMLGQGRE